LDDAAKSMIENLKTKFGKSLDEWIKIVNKEKSNKLFQVIIISFIIALLSGSCKKESSTEPAETKPYPQEFAALYEELSDNLSARETELRTDWNGTPTQVIYSATLLSASSNNGNKLFNATFREGNSLILNSLAALGIKGIVIQINYPILTPGFTSNAADYLTAFSEIADEIHSLGLKVIVEHNVLLPGYSSLNPTAYYSTLTKTSFGQGSYLEVKSIVEQINPDYLSLVTEPGTYESALKLQMSLTDWTVYVESVVNQLSVDVPGYTTKLGAGSGAWEDPGFVNAFAAINGLDYIDIHSYPLTNGITNYLKNLETWSDLIRSINSTLEIISSESWLYKAQASELGGAPTNSAFFARDVYSFWEPLDAQFLNVLTLTAYTKNFSVIAPFWSNYFLAYLDYDDPSLAGLTPDEILSLAFTAASDAVVGGKTSLLGDHYKDVITSGLK